MTGAFEGTVSALGRGAQGVCILLGIIVFFSSFTPFVSGFGQLIFIGITLVLFVAVFVIELGIRVVR